MSFANKPTRPDSKDTAALRREYEKKAQEFRDTSDPATKAKLRDDKQKAFARVVEQMTNERRVSLKDKQRVLAGMGLYKTDAQLKKEREEAKAETTGRVIAEQRSR
jgi:hypothetical protein